jgi:hypothetical protein
MDAQHRGIEIGKLQPQEVVPTLCGLSSIS